MSNEEQYTFPYLGQNEAEGIVNSQGQAQDVSYEQAVAATGVSVVPGIPQVINRHTSDSIVANTGYYSDPRGNTSEVLAAFPMLGAGNMDAKKYGCAPNVITQGLDQFSEASSSTSAVVPQFPMQPPRQSQLQNSSAHSSVLSPGMSSTSTGSSARSPLRRAGSRGHHKRTSSTNAGGIAKPSTFGHQRKKSLKFSEDQDRLIMMYRGQGKPWSEVAKLAGIQSDVSAKNRYCLLKKRQEEERAALSARSSARDHLLPTISETSSWSQEDVEYLKSLLEHGEKAKWRYISAAMAERHDKKIQPFACEKKFKEMFGVAESSSLLASSLSYAVYPNGWACLDHVSSQPTTKYEYEGQGGHT